MTMARSSARNGKLSLKLTSRDHVAVIGRAFFMRDD